MALVKFGGGIVQMTGSIAGTTFARNKSGNYARAKTKPVNPNTALQQTIRAAMSSLTTRWSQVLTGAQRTAWGLYASSVSMTNRLGEAINLTGMNHYIRSNSILHQNTIAPVDAGPTIFELPEQDAAFAVSISEATQLVSVVFDDTMPWLDEDDAYMILYQGSPQNPQRNFFAGPWRLLGTIAGDSVTPPTTPTTIACSFVATEGQRVWVYGRIARADGRLSEPFRASCFCAA